MVIILFGLSGSGKSTLANLLGKRLGLRVIHPSGILRDLIAKRKINMAKTRYGRGFWESKKGQELLKKRLEDDKPVDLEADQYLLQEIAKDNLIMDSWNMAWLSNADIKIYLRAPLMVRALRVAKRGRLDPSNTKKIVSTKDEDTRKLFLKLYGIDIKKDLKVFDLIIDTKDLTKKEVFNKLLDFISK